MESKDNSTSTKLWLKFWLEPGDLDGTLRLQLNDGILSVKSTTGVPTLDADGRKLFLTHHW